LELATVGCFSYAVVLTTRKIKETKMTSDDYNSISTGLGVSFFITVMLVTIAVLLLPAIFYLLTLQKALTRCSPENRGMAPGMVWLLLIPLFSIVWHFIVVTNMAQSLGAEFRKRGIAEELKPGQSLGMAMCILGVCSIIPVLGVLCGLAALVCWIMYWVKIAGFSNKIAAPPSIPMVA
jgi:hypothetical protein